MNKTLIGILAVLFIVGIAGAAVMTSRQSSETSMLEKTDAMIEPTVMMKKTDTSIEQPDAMMAKVGAYMPYSQQAFADASKTKRVLFFHAPWCPTCRPADEEFTKNADQIPTGVTLFKTDYDSETALKTTYAITYQHTFVQVDENGKEIAKWNGGGLKELVENIN